MQSHTLISFIPLKWLLRVARFFVRAKIPIVTKCFRYSSSPIRGSAPHGDNLLAAAAAARRKIVSLFTLFTLLCCYSEGKYVLETFVKRQILIFFDCRPNNLFFSVTLRLWYCDIETNKQTNQHGGDNICSSVFIIVIRISICRHARFSDRHAIIVISLSVPQRTLSAIIYICAARRRRRHRAAVAARTTRPLTEINYINL